MFKKTLRVLANIVLVLIPFYPITEGFFLIVTHQNFGNYLFACSIITLVTLLLIWFIRKSNDPQNPPAPTLLPAAWLLFALGILVMVPLHMGPPKESTALLQSATEERFRYIMLIVAVIVFAAGVLYVTRSLWAKLTSIQKAVIIPLVITIPVSLWDYYDSYLFSEKLTVWVNSGKMADDFFPGYDFHHTWRAAGRILLYVIAGWLSIILYKKAVISKWIVITINIFCLAGIGFCIACVFIGFQFYFPFMVPAIALAPAYWTGLALLNRLRAKSNPF